MPGCSSFPRVCVALGLTDPRTLQQQAQQEILNGETFLEFRLDYLPEPGEGTDIIRELTAAHPELKILATCRRQDNRGQFNGTVEQQIRVLEDAVSAGARAVDVEIESAEQLTGSLGHLRQAATLIVSYHNFDNTPGMAAVVRRFSKISADMWKIVTTARKPTDIFRVLSCVKKTAAPKVILLSMGDIGAPSRILAPAFGSVYTYAAPSGVEGTAPGQLSAKQLRNLYRIDKLSQSTRIYGVIADPVRHSMSPLVHNRALQARRADAVYIPFLVHPANLRDFMTLANNLPIAGFSVTIPHKQKIIRYLDHIEPLARRIGAVNTVCRKAGRWRGSNTDVHGVIEPLRKHVKLCKSKVLVAGSGGAARGAAFALADAGAQVTVAGRTYAKVQALAKAAGAEASRLEDVQGRHFDVLVHATPLGMFPDTGSCFFEDRIPADLVFDMVYNPLETRLLQRAREQGCSVIDGTEMFIEQAAHQFELWTGETAPRALMRKSLLEALSSVH